MTNEEKKAIAYLKSYCTNDVLYDNTQYEQIKILLNLIENQQKEIEELKYKVREHICIEAHEQVKQLYISKAKIKAILKKYDKKEIEYAPDFYKEIQSLLEEE